MSYLKELFDKFSIPIPVQQLIITLITLVFIIHVVGCFWYTASFGNIYSNRNWVTVNHLENEGLISKYLVSLYWATVTCTTVGYGDILPTNSYELIWAMLIIVFGVSLFSYILGNLASQFAEIAIKQQTNDSRLRQIDILDNKFKLGFDLSERL